MTESVAAVLSARGLDSPDHLVGLHDRWSIWRWVWVRGAGFPARMALDLAAPQLVEAADRLAGAEAIAEAARSSAIVALERVRASKPVNRALKAVRRGAVVAPAEELGDAGPALEALIEADAHRASTEAEVVAAYDGDSRRTGVFLQSLAREPRFREALLWQNRRAVHNGIASLLRHPPEARDAKLREQRRLLASFLQRYCVKNDTIGFFGPVGWADASAGPVDLEARPGGDLLDKRTVYFEHWAIDALAQIIAGDPEVRPHLRPRRMPTVRLDGQTVFYPVDRQRELPLAYARLLAACDGRRTASEIAEELCRDPALELEDEAEVLELLGDLTEKRFCTWTLEITTVTEWPERHLRALVEAIPGEARGRALALLDALEVRRTAVADAAGDPDRLDRALGELETTFEELTSRSSTRKGGETYAGRTLVFEDCRRDLDLEIGAGLLRRLGAPLALILQTARWYTHRIAELYRVALGEAFDEAARGASSIDYLTYWTHAKRLFPEGRARSPLIDQASTELQRAWCSLAALDPAARRIELSTSGLAARVAELFAAPHPGWPGARYHAPDVMIAAPSADTIRAGGGVIVLGELHPSVSTMHFLAQKEHPDRSALIRAREIDLPDPIPTPVIAKAHASRADHMWVSRHDVDIELGSTPSWRPPDNVLPVGSLIVTREEGNVHVRDRERTRSFEIVEFFGSYLSAAIGTELDLFPLEDHLPRVSIDGVVIVREQWRHAPESLAFAAMEPGAAQFVAARRWAQAAGLPRWVFLKVPEEPKPMYVDFDSPLYVEMLAKSVRKASRLTFSEMLPAPSETWLPDADGNTYACELRMLAVDPTTWRSPGGIA